ncbi:hypothetical protein [Archangium sp.]|uniref:hypothetical protein n=1 Tax=Archangium sp. TaxID=1872627 RepID=UPI00286BE010|nr:hypothetical protein [Archangium sp.]
MKKQLKSVGAMFLAVSLLSGCDPDPTPAKPGPVSERCDEATAEYKAFDVINHEPQDKRLVAIDAMMAQFPAAEADPTKAPAAADAILAKYKDPATAIQAKVLAREDKHFTGDAAAVGPALDAAILGAVDELRAADTTLKVKLAKQRFQKAGIYRFLYLSVMEELYEPSYKHYDEAFGYLGTGASNADAGRKGLARLATSRDGNNGTTLNPELFALIKEGSCIIEEALKAKNADTMEYGADEQYSRFVQRFDARLQLVFVYSVGHELFDIDLFKTNPNTAYEKLVEGEGFFRTLEPYMNASPGSNRANLSAKLRAAFDKAITKAKAGDTSWINEMNATGLLTELETVYGVDVKA